MCMSIFDISVEEYKKVLKKGRGKHYKSPCGMCEQQRDCGECCHYFILWQRYYRKENADGKGV